MGVSRDLKTLLLWFGRLNYCTLYPALCAFPAAWENRYAKQS